MGSQDNYCFNLKEISAQVISCQWILQMIFRVRTLESIRFCWPIFQMKKPRPSEGKWLIWSRSKTCTEDLRTEVRLFLSCLMLFLFFLLFIYSHAFLLLLFFPFKHQSITSFLNSFCTQMVNKTVYKCMQGKLILLPGLSPVPRSHYCFCIIFQK